MLQKNLFVPAGTIRIKGDKVSFILIFDIPWRMGTLKRQVNRKLARANAEQIQQSVWKLDSLNELMDIAAWIKSSGGKASILEEKFIFK